VDNESRAAFEAWFNPDDSKNYWDCWQASRKQALEDALEIYKGASCANQTASHCYHEIKKVMK